MPRILGALLAAGAGRRMGGTNKLLAPIGRRPMVRAAALALVPAPLAEVLVIVGHDAASVREALRGLPVRCVDNPEWEEGQAASVRCAATAALESGADALLLALADQPTLDALRVRAVCTAWDGRAPLVLPVRDGRASHPVLVAAPLFPELLTLRGDVGARDVVRAHLGAAIRLDLPALPDVDTLDDLVSLGCEAGQKHGLRVPDAGPGERPGSEPGGAKQARPRRSMLKRRT